MAVLGLEIAGRYRLDERLGAGGMSTVYRARDNVLERQVAVKLLAEHLSEDDGFLARFRREALSAAKLIHPNVVQVYDSGHDPEAHRHFIVMEYVEGPTVAQLMREHDRLPVAQAVDIGVQSCQGLEYAHRHGVIHRDVKPGNLILNPDGVVKLVDFGIAKAAEDTGITQIGSVVGTAAYLSPERAQGEEATASADVYSLGVVLYQLLAGRLPYETGSLTELAMRQQEGMPDPLHLVNQEVSPELSRAVTRSLAARPEHRYASAAEFGEALREGARGRDSAVTMLLETAATRVASAGEQEAATNVLQPVPAALPQPVPAQASSRPSPRAARRAARAPRAEPKPRRRRGAFTRFMALMFVFLLVATVVAVIVIVNLDGSGTQDFERVVNERVQDQIDGIRKLIEDATQ
jgi:serine/threonine protein kinase